MSTEQDPHKHALYRPHMGDMTGWRFLEIDEEIISGDQCFEKVISPHGWRETFQPNQGYTPQSFPHNDYRRRVTPVESKQGEQKRFVTVVIPADSVLLEFPGLIGCQMREGNALARLDDIEERVIAAIRKA